MMKFGYQSIIFAMMAGLHRFFRSAGALGQRTKTIRIGTFVLLLPLGKHPIQVVEDATTVDILCNGRFDLGLV